MASVQPWLFDAVVQFLKSPNWGEPIQQFIDRNCLIFTTEEENALSYTEVHDQFRELMESLLEGFLSEMGVSAEDFFTCCIVGSQKDRFLEGVVKYILALDDFETFRKLMTKRNVSLSEEVVDALDSFTPAPVAVSQPPDGFTPLGESDDEIEPESEPPRVETPSDSPTNVEIVGAEKSAPEVAEPEDVPKVPGSAPELPIVDQIPPPELVVDSAPTVQEKPDSSTPESSSPASPEEVPESSPTEIPLAIEPTSQSTLSSLPSLAPSLGVTLPKRPSRLPVLPGVKPRTTRRVVPGQHFSVLDVVESAESSVPRPRPKDPSPQPRVRKLPSSEEPELTSSSSSGTVGVLRKLVHRHFGKKSPSRRRAGKSPSNPDRNRRARRRKMDAVFTDLEVEED